MLRHRYANLPGILAVQEFGSIPHPGISDMDFFVIIEPSATAILPSFSSYSEEERYIISHRHYVVSALAWPYLQYLDPWFFACIPLVGDTSTYAFRPRQFSDEGYAALSLNFVYQKLVYGCLLYLAETLSTQDLPVRHFFEEFKNFRYFYREFRKIGLAVADADPSQELYDDIGAKWFSMSRSEQEKALIQVWDAFRTSVRTVTPLLLQATKERVSWINAPSSIDRRRHARRWSRFPASIILDLQSRVYVYQKGVTSVTIEQEVPRGFLHSFAPARTVYRLPLELFGYPGHHIVQSGALSEYYRQRLTTDLDQIPLYENSDLSFLYDLANRDLHASRNVRNGKWYEICYGFRPTSDDALSHASFLRKCIRYILSFVGAMKIRIAYTLPPVRSTLWVEHEKR